MNIITSMNDWLVTHHWWVEIGEISLLVLLGIYLSFHHKLVMRHERERTRQQRESLDDHGRNGNRSGNSCFVGQLDGTTEPGRSSAGVFK